MSSIDLNNNGPCGNIGWCTQCSTLSLKDNQGILKCLDEIMLDNFKYIQQITVLIDAPKDSAYKGQTLQLDIDIPDEYPKDQCLSPEAIEQLRLEENLVDRLDKKFSASEQW